MRALIAGCGGFVGPYLARFLATEGIEVIGVDSRPIAAERLPAGVRREVLDITDFKSVVALLQDTQPDQIYNLAALTTVAVSLENPKLTFEVGVGGALNIYEAVRATGISSRVLFVSSGHVYAPGATHHRGHTEDEPLAPSSPYTASKIMGEVLSRSYVNAYGLNIVIARPFTHIGPDQPPIRACAAFAQQIARIKKGFAPPVLRTGNLQTQRDFTDVRDVVRAYWMLLMKGAAGSAYNVCAGKLYWMHEVIGMLKKLSGVEFRIESEVSPSRGKEDEALSGDPSKIVSELHWEAQIPLEKSLADILAFWERQPDTSAL